MRSGVSAEAGTLTASGNLGVARGALSGLETQREAQQRQFESFRQQTEQLQRSIQRKDEERTFEERVAETEQLQALEDALKDFDINILSATNVDDAMELMLSTHISMACIDIQMPRKDGFDLITMMKGNPTTKKIPFVMVTGMEYDYTALMKSFRMGALDYIIKPVDSDIVKNKLGALARLFSSVESERAVIKEVKKLVSHIKKEDLNLIASSSLSFIEECIKNGTI